MNVLVNVHENERFLVSGTFTFTFTSTFTGRSRLPSQRALEKAQLYPLVGDITVVFTLSPVLV